MRKLPQASKPSVATLRLRRRAQLRTPISLNENFAETPPGPPASEESKPAASARPAINSSAPALKNNSAFAASLCQKAQPTANIAASPVAAANHHALLLLWSLELGAWSFSIAPSSSNSRAGCCACLRRASQMVSQAISTAARAPTANVRGWA